MKTYVIGNMSYEYDILEDNTLKKLVEYDSNGLPVYENVLTLNYYKFFYNDRNYIIGFSAVPEGEEYDWYGQASAYQNPDLAFGCYMFVDGEIIFDQAEYNKIIAAQEEAQRQAEKEAQRMPAQIAYTAMMTDTELPE